MFTTYFRSTQHLVIFSANKLQARLFHMCQSSESCVVVMVWVYLGPYIMEWVDMGPYIMVLVAMGPYIMTWEATGPYIMVWVAMGPYIMVRTLWVHVYWYG